MLFVCRVNPFAPVGELEAETVRKIVRTARELVLLNVASGAAPGRATRASLDREQRLWVYARGSEPCRRCGTPIEYRKQGPHARGTYWCAKCQERVG